MSISTVKPWHFAALLTVIVAIFVTLWPLGLGRDYMNHLARTYIEGHLQAEPILRQYYGVSFDFIPDLTMDLIIPWLSQIIGIYAAGAVTVWLAFVLPPVAGVLLAQTLHGRVTWVSLLGFLTVFNFNMGYGFVNFNASIGLALLAFVLWIRMQPGWRRTAAFAPIGLVLVANHALAFLAFGYLAVTWELVQYCKGARGSLATFIRQLVTRDGLAMVGGLIFLGLSVGSAADLPQIPAPLYDPMAKTIAILAGTLFGDVLIAAILSCIIITVCLLSVRNKWITFAPGMGWICAAVLILVVLMPTAIFGIWGLHFRFTALLFVLIAASVQSCPPIGKMTRYGSSAVCLAMLCLMFYNGGVEMQKVDQRAEEFRQLLADMPRGSKTLIVYSDEKARTAFSAHGASMAVIERQAFVPNLFTNTSPVDVAPAMANFHMPQFDGFSPSELRTAATAKMQPSTNGYWSLGFANDWPTRWDNIVLFRTPGHPGLENLPVCEVAAMETAILYKIGTCP